MATQLRFVINGNELDRAEAIEYPVLVAGDIVQERNAAAAFESGDEFLEWARQTPYGDRIVEINSILSAINPNDQAHEQRLREKTHKTVRALEELANTIGMPVWSEGLFLKAIEEGILRSSLIFRHIDRGGDFRPIVTGFPVPNFQWIGFYDCASSALVSGSLLLCARRFFRGARLWLFGAPAVTWNLTDFGFNDRAASGVAFG